MRCIQFTGQQAISQKKNERRLQQNAPVWSLNTLKTVDLEYHLSLSIA